MSALFLTLFKGNPLLESAEILTRLGMWISWSLAALSGSSHPLPLLRPVVM